MVILLTAMTPYLVSGAEIPGIRASEAENQPIIPPVLAQEEENGLYWIKDGATYKSGEVVLFYATGAGYGPDEPQEIDPIAQSTRYVPVSWSVGDLGGNWRAYSIKTTGHTDEDTGSYIPGEYRFKGSFLLDVPVNGGSVPYTLEVGYQEQIYNGMSGTWDAHGPLVYKTVDFFVKNVSVTPAPLPRLQAPKISGIENQDAGIFLRWTKAAQASGYHIYRKSQGGSWTKAASVRGQDQLSYTDRAVKGKNGVQYAYSVQAYNGTGTSTYDKTGRQILRLTTPALSESCEKINGEMEIKWGQNAKAGGYQIQYATSSTFMNAKVTQAGSGKTTTKTIKNLRKAGNYYVRIRSFKKIGNTTYYSAWSKGKYIKTKKPFIARASRNGLYWINPGATYRSGATLQFYATGAGYGPEEPQELNPVKGSTRYVPFSWRVGTAHGSWRRYTEETIEQKYRGNHIPGEYRFKSSFTLSTTSMSSVPFTLQVRYKEQVYNGKRWRTTGIVAFKQVRFYIRNVS